MLQVVIGCLTEQHCSLGQTFQSSKTVRALDYFAVPQQLWPTGLLLLHRELEHFRSCKRSQKVAANDIMRQVRPQLLLHQPSGEPISKQEQDVRYMQGFMFQKNEGRGRPAYRLIDPKDWRCPRPAILPASLKLAVVEAGIHEHLDITFNDMYDTMTVTVSFKA